MCHHPATSFFCKPACAFFSRLVLDRESECPLVGDVSPCVLFLAVSNALQGVAAKLPADTRVFCGHEYTVSNLQFARSVEPENSAVSDKLDWSRRILATGGYTVPSTASFLSVCLFYLFIFLCYNEHEPSS